MLGDRLPERLFPQGDAFGKKVPVEHWAGSIEYEVIGVLSADDSKPPYMIDQYADVGFIPLNNVALMKGCRPSRQLTSV